MIPEDPHARRTRSGQQPPKPTSLRKTVHKANLARTTVTVTQGSRRSQRTVTQIASTTSLANAQKAILRELKGGSSRKRKRGDLSSSEEEGEDDHKYGAKKRVRPQKNKARSKKVSAGSDSSLTDVDEVGFEIASEISTTETNTIQTDLHSAIIIANDVGVETPSSTVIDDSDSATYTESYGASASQTGEPALTPVTTVSQELRTRSPSPASLPIGAVEAAESLEREDGAPAGAQGDARESEDSTQQISSETADGLKPAAHRAVELGSQLAALAGEAKAALWRPFISAPVASDIASLTSQSSMGGMEDEPKDLA